MTEKSSSKREKKNDRRAAKAERKARKINAVKEGRPNNLLLAVLIFGALLAMFIAGKGIEYFQKDATLEKYLERNGGAEAYSGMYVNEHTVADVSAKKNTLAVKLTIIADDEDALKEAEEAYTGEDSDRNVKDVAAYFLYSIKPQTRALFADANVTVTSGDKVIAEKNLSYWEAVRFIEEETKRLEKEQAEAGSVDTDTEDAAEAGTDEEEENVSED